MNFQCLLYGHEWRHPGEFAVVLSKEHGPVHQFQCTRCETERGLQSTGGEWVGDTR